MASSLSVIIITTIVKLCNLFDSVRAPRKLVSLLLFFFLSFLLSLSLAFILPPSFLLPFLFAFSSFLPQLFDEYCVGIRARNRFDDREEWNERRRY